MKNLQFPRYLPERTDASLAVVLRLAQELGSRPGSYVVIGGMAVYLLCREHSQLGTHLGSFDVDLALVPDALRNESHLGSQLRSFGLRPDRNNPRSMYWFADMEDKTSVPVDLLSPKISEQSPDEIDIAGIRAWCPPGTGAVLEAPVQVVRDGVAWGLGTVSQVGIAVANGPAIVMAKA